RPRFLSLSATSGYNIKSGVQSRKTYIPSPSPRCNSKYSPSSPPSWPPPPLRLAVSLSPLGLRVPPAPLDVARTPISPLTFCAARGFARCRCIV
ncbi:unnamed protein product, partial [Mycena citricolor]